MDKKQKKEQRQKDWGLKVDGQIPLILVSDADEPIQAILSEIVDGIAAIGLQLVFVEPKEVQKAELMKKWAAQHPHAVTVVSREDSQSDVFDIALLDELSDEKLAELKAYNRVPVADAGKIYPFDPIAEQGNGFVFEKGNAWSLFAALVRAAETYRFPYDWKTLLKAVKKSD